MEMLDTKWFKTVLETYNMERINMGIPGLELWFYIVFVSCFTPQSRPLIRIFGSICGTP